VSSVRAAFHYVRSGRTVVPELLADEDALTALLAEQAGEEAA
jgi:DNA helicase-2/ATP-dependent DNA helicase PcrA